MSLTATAAAVPTPRTDRILVALSVAASILGLWSSLHYCFAFWFLSADVTNIATLWDGFRQYGWTFLTTYSYAPDNWLFSLALPEFLYFYLFDPSPTMVVAVGWFIFVGCVAMTLLIARRLGGRWMVMVLAPVLLLVTQAAMGSVGSYGQPVSHNISLFWGLVVTYAGMTWLAERRVWALLAAVIVLFFAAASDPWTTAAFSVPVVAAGLGLAALPGRREDRVAAFILAAGAFAAALLAATRVFGLLSFLPPSELFFADAQMVWQHVGLLGGVLTLLFDMLPGHDAGQYLSGMPGPALIIATCTVLAVMLLASLVALLRCFGALPAAARFAVIVAGLSSGATASAFCLTAFATDLWAGRYLVNLGVFLPLLVATAVVQLGGRWGAMPRRVALAVGGLLALTGALSDANAWLRGVPYSEDFHFRDMDAFLKSQGLRYGYGSYFGSNATTFTWLNRGAVTMRAVWVDPATGFSHPGTQTSPLWFRPEDQPAGESQTFLVFNGDCTTLDVCIAGATKQFGAPERILSFQGSTVLIWPHRLNW